MNSWELLLWLLLGNGRWQYSSRAPNVAVLLSTTLPEPAKGPSRDRFLSGVDCQRFTMSCFELGKWQRSGQWQLALYVFSLLSTTRTAPDVVSYGLMIDAQSAGR